jgi:nitrogen-specific signal transduction histidine kinase
VRNALGIIKNYAGLAARKDTTRCMQEEMEVISEEASRISRLLAETDDARSAKDSGAVPVDVNALLSEVSKVMQRSTLDALNIKLHVKLDPSVPMVVGRPDTLKQVFINLINNAAEAMMSGGDITLETRSRLGSRDGRHDPRARQVEIMLRDNGPGIAQEVKERLFEPLVSSKGPGHSGMGLAIAHGIIESFHGTLSVETGQGGGTLFRALLPAQ